MERKAVPWDEKIIMEPSITYNELHMLPGLTRKLRKGEKISFRTPVLRFKKGEKSRIYLNIPMTSAIMQAVSGPDLAIALARQGGLSFIFGNQPIESQAIMVDKVKKHKAGFVTSDSNLSPDTTLGDAVKLSEQTGHSTIPITWRGRPDSRLYGLLTNNDFWKYRDDLGDKVINYMTPIDKLVTGNKGISLEEANEILWHRKKSCLPIVNKKGQLVSLVFKKDYETNKDNPLALVDNQKRYVVGAGIDTWDYKKRVPALLDAGVDVLCIDTSDAHSEYVKDVVAWIRKKYGDFPLGAGNIVTDEAADYLCADPAVDFIKIGLGGGSICITREQKGIGRGQATAVYEVAKARNKFYEETGIYVPCCGDGAIVHDYHLSSGLSLGSDWLMLGRYFARCEESPGEKITDPSGLVWKEYWGEGSYKAQNWKRYATGQDKKLKFAEGVAGKVPYAGRLRDVVEGTMTKIEATMHNLGCLTIEDMHKYVRMQRVSPEALREGSAHDIVLTEMVNRESIPRR